MDSFVGKLRGMLAVCVSAEHVSELAFEEIERLENELNEIKESYKRIIQEPCPSVQGTISSHVLDNNMFQISILLSTQIEQKLLHDWLENKLGETRNDKY